MLADLELHFDLPTCATLCAVLGGGMSDEPCVRAGQSRTLGTLLKQAASSSSAGTTDHPSRLHLFAWVLYFCLSLPRINHRQAEAPS